MSNEAITLDQFWRCPDCGTAIGTGPPAKFTRAPHCGMCKQEMEQTTAEGFSASGGVVPDE